MYIYTKTQIWNTVGPYIFILSIEDYKYYNNFRDTEYKTRALRADLLSNFNILLILSSSRTIQYDLWWDGNNMTTCFSIFMVLLAGDFIQMFDKIARMVFNSKFGRAISKLIIWLQCLKAELWCHHYCIVQEKHKGSPTLIICISNMNLEGITITFEYIDENK